MDILMNVGSLIIGALISWFLTDTYYKKGIREQKRDNDILASKLSDTVKETILKSDKEKLSVLELNELLEKKTIDFDNYEIDPLPYKVCPKCGSDKLERKGVHAPTLDENYYTIKCNNEDCNWGEWTQ